MNEMDQTEFDFSENQETEQERLEREVLAAGGRVGRSEGRFTLGFDESEGYRRGNEHMEIAGLFFWRREKSNGSSRWISQSAHTELRESITETNKRWYEENKEMVAERERVYREENRKKEAARRKRYWEENREKLIEAKKRYREENREKVSETNKRWYEGNKEMVAERERVYREENPDKVRAKTARYRARRREALDPNANKSIIESRYQAAKYLSDVTGIDWHVDHTQPLSRGGKDHENNLQVVPASWNMSKSAHHDKRWIEDSNIYRYATAVEKRFEDEAKKSEKK